MKLVCIETIQLREHPNLLFVRLHTDEGLVGHGETYYIAEAIRGFIHEFAAPLLLGKDPLAIEGHWRTLYQTCARFGAKGTEMRAISALDVALWDILAQAAKMPLYQLLGGAAHDRLPIYNTCAGPIHGRHLPGHASGAGSASVYEDLVAFMTQADELAVDLVNEGITAMKIWPFDLYGREKGGHRIDAADLDAGLEPLRKIRGAVGRRMEIMIEGHAYWSLPAAIRIARALEEFEPAWIERASCS